MVPHPQPAQDADPRRWLGLVTISLAVALIIADATIVNVAIPSVIADLGISTTQAEWITSVYSLVFAALLITVGRLGDLYGRRRLLLAGTVVFVTASVLCALAPSGALLIVARVLQGIGGAMILPSTLSTLNATFRGRERGIAFAVWGSTIGGMAAVGPLLGGWLTTTFSWRWAFGINVFVGAVIVTGLLLYVRETKEDGAAKGIDLPGTALSVVGLGGLVFSLIEGQRYGWWNASDAAADELGWTAAVSPIVPVAALAVLAVAAFVAVERRRQRQGRVVVLDLALFGVPSFRNGNVAAMIISLGEFGLLFLLPLYIQNILGLSATRTGLVLVALAAGSFFSAPLAPQLSNRLGPRAVVRIGLAAEIVGILGIALSVGVDISVWRLVPWLFLYGLGVGFATAQLTGVILADVPVAKSGQASGTQSTARQVGSAFGVAIIGAVLVTTLTSSATDRLEAAGVPTAQTKALVAATTSSAGAAIGALRGEQGADAPAVVALEEAYVAATRQVGLVASGLVLLGLLASFSLGSGRDAAEPQDAGTEPVPGRG
ncbi:MFS transporter [Kineosporia sp. R_H_3]|uniref:MFS transporter n=1 Tax=Kineosporia sp. R_H_3 TaxID=1961848 RepID=UPI000B4B53B4|nr:MFS transporter [Kineosporia sp. R_H_3]